jgi:AcrR family transcriptional regulator
MVDNGTVACVARTRIIDRASIIRVALQIADESGLHSVTLQAVAHRLGVTAMSLYGHIDNKAALLDGVVEELLAEFELPDQNLPWRERLSLIGRAARDSAHRHPDVFPLLLNRAAATPGAHRVRQAVYGALRDAGLADDHVDRAERLLTTMIVGFATSEVSGRFTQSQADVEADYVYLERLLTRMIAVETGESQDTESQRADAGPSEAPPA